MKVKNKLLEFDKKIKEIIALENEKKERKKREQEKERLENEKLEKERLEKERLEQEQFEKTIGDSLTPQPFSYTDMDYSNVPPANIGINIPRYEATQELKDRRKAKAAALGVSYERYMKIIFHEERELHMKIAELEKRIKEFNPDVKNTKEARRYELGFMSKTPISNNKSKKYRNKLLAVIRNYEWIKGAPERERLERERQAIAAENERIRLEREKIEQEKAEKFRIEQERIDKERQRKQSRQKSIEHATYGVDVGEELIELKKLLSEYQINSSDPSFNYVQNAITTGIQLLEGPKADIIIADKRTMKYLRRAIKEMRLGNYSTKSAEKLIGTIKVMENIE